MGEAPIFSGSAATGATSFGGSLGCSAGAAVATSFGFSSTVGFTTALGGHASRNEARNGAASTRARCVMPSQGATRVPPRSAAQRPQLERATLALRHAHRGEVRPLLLPIPLAPMDGGDVDAQ